MFFGPATFLEEEFFRAKIASEELLFWSRNFCTTTTFSEDLHFGKSEFFGKTIFRITQFFRRSATFSEEFLFRSIFFQKRYFFTATLLVHSYISYLSVIQCAQCQLHTVKVCFLCICYSSKSHPRQSWVCCFFKVSTF